MISGNNSVLKFYCISKAKNWEALLESIWKSLLPEWLGWCVQFSIENGRQDWRREEKHETTEKLKPD